MDSGALSRQFFLSGLLLALLLGQPLWAKDSFKQAISLYENKSYDDALKLFLQEPKNSPLESQSLYYSALCYLNTGKKEKADQLFAELLKRFPDTEAARHSKVYLKANKAQAPIEKNKETANEIAIPFRRTANGQITVNAELHGRSINMIFDTGAEECLFGKNQIDRANLSKAERSRLVQLNSVSGKMSVYQIMADIKLGSLERNLPVCVQENDMEAAILGQPFFKGYVCAVDNQAGLIRLKNKTEMSSIPYDSVRVPFREEGDKLIVQAELNGRKCDMCFDTGAFGVCLSVTQCKKLGLEVPESSSSYTKGPNGQSVPSWQIHADLSLGPIKKKYFPVRVIESETSFPLLGQNFFGERSFSIDREKKEIRFAR